MCSFLSGDIWKNLLNSCTSPHCLLLQTAARLHCSLKNYCQVPSWASSNSMVGVITISQIPWSSQRAFPIQPLGRKTRPKTLPRHIYHLPACTRVPAYTKTETAGKGTISFLPLSSADHYNKDLLLADNSVPTFTNYMMLQRSMNVCIR